MKFMEFSSLNLKKFFLMGITFTAPFFNMFAIDATIGAWGGDIKNILDAAVVPFAIAGGFMVFIQYMLGSADASKKFMMFCIGLAIFALSPEISSIFLG